ncbi:hypothetical protein [Limnobacter parvus]|uniref:hypothetical protein n=1 Tax=Limnobacter parvus TaxID=2939690 RepID=UPI0027D46FBA|nr:hypothetical protein [Limnobacter parvus]
MIGGLESLNQGLEETPLAPITAVTGALADGLATVSDGIASVSEQDPTGVANLLAETVGQPQEGFTNDQGGLAGTVSNLAQGLAEGAEPTPLDPLVNPLAQTLGFTENEPVQENMITTAAANPRARNKGEVDGVAQGLTKAGNVLASDKSPLSPLTAEILAPVVGTKNSDAGSPGVPGTLQEVAEGLTDLTNPESALAPLAPVTGGLAFVVAGGEDPTGGQLPEQLSGGLAGGVVLLGEQLTNNAETAGPGEPLIETVGNLLGGERAEDDGGEPGEGEEPGEGGPTGTPLDAILAPLTDLAGGGLPAIPGLPGGDEGEPGEGGPTGTPLDAVLAPLTDLAGGGLPAIPGLPGGDEGEPGEGGTTGTPLDLIIDPIADAVGGGEGGIPETPLSPITDALMENADPAVFAENLASVIEDIGTNTPLEAVTEPLVEALRSGGLPDMGGGDDGEDPEEPEEPNPTAGPIESAARQFVDVAPIEMIPVIGQPIEDGIVTGAMALDGLLAGGIPGAPTIPGLPGGDEGEPGEGGPTGTPLDAVLAPLTDLAGGGLPGLPGGDEGEPGEGGPTGTPLDAVLAPLTDLAGGGLPGLPGDDGGDEGGPTGTPLDAVLAPLTDLAGGGLPGLPGDDGGDEGGPTGTPLDAVLAPLTDLAGGGLPAIPGLPGGDTGGETPAPNPEAGPIESAAQQFVDIAPIEMIPVIGQPIEDGIVTGAALLDSILAGGIPGGGDTDGPTGTPLDTVLAPLTDLAGGGIPGGGDTDGPTGTPLDAVLAPLTDLAGGGLPDAGGLPIPTDPSALTDLLGGDGSPISTVTDLLDPSALPIPGLPTA